MGWDGQGRGGVGCTGRPLRPFSFVTRIGGTVGRAQGHPPGPLSDGEGCALACFWAATPSRRRVPLAPWGDGRGVGAAAPPTCGGPPHSHVALLLLARALSLVLLLLRVWVRVCGCGCVCGPGGWVVFACLCRAALELWDSAGQEDYAKYVGHTRLGSFSRGGGGVGAGGRKGGGGWGGRRRQCQLPRDWRVRVGIVGEATTRPGGGAAAAQPQR